MAAIRAERCAPALRKAALRAAERVLAFAVALRAERLRPLGLEHHRVK
jgi:hypothetical protein